MVYSLYINNSIDENVLERGDAYMDCDRAYLLGLVIGGGIFGTGESFCIRLPYKQWGDISINPSRAGKIAEDILKVVKPMMKNTYGLDIYYQESPREWLISCDGDLSLIKNELIHYNLVPEGEIRKNASLLAIVPDLVDDNMKRRFIAGLADTIGSTAKSHRRFTDEVQIISFEISGYKYDFVCQLCQLLYSVKCYSDQILWNHPNFHSGNDPYYRTWKKGFKLRVELDQYAKFGAFAFRTKAESANENLELQSHKNEALPCAEKVINVKDSCVHIDENYPSILTEIRGGHYIHNKHVCAVMGCPYAPYEQLDELLNDAGKIINPFPILRKGTIAENEDIMSKYPIYQKRVYRIEKIDVFNIYELYQKDPHSLLWEKSVSSGYPTNIIVQAIAFLIAAHYGKLKGNRPMGNQDELISLYLDDQQPFDITVKIPDLLTPVIMICEEHSVMVGPKNPDVYNKLVRRDKNNKYKLIVRDITEDDLNE